MNEHFTKPCYVIIDSNGRYNGSIGISSHSDTGSGEWFWNYNSRTYPASWVNDKEKCEIELLRLKEINEIGGFDLDFKVVELTGDQLYQSMLDQKEHDDLMGYPSFMRGLHNLSSEYRQVEKGCVGKHRKIVKEIQTQKSFSEKVA